MITIKDESQRVPIKLWADEVEPQAMAQLKNTAGLPFVFKHVAAMPDVHFGLGATVGSVVATKGAVVPAAVGVDIGCGMMAVQLDADVRIARDKAAVIRHSIERSIPVGFDQHRTNQDEEMGLLHLTWADIASENADKRLYEKAARQMGTLGGGNHFIELCEDTNGGFWVMLHSGSRGVGNRLARWHMNEAKGLMRKMFIELPDPDLAYFAEQTKEYDAYMTDLYWAQNYAKRNREVMMERVLKDISHAFGLGGAPIPKLREINCHHNYAETENHYGENVLVTRKGAVRAREGDYGIIPGSMGTRSYIVKGKGNFQSFCSCSHGAGRKMSRNQARAQYTVEDLAKQTEGVNCRKDEGVLDELPSAYKDIDTVMANQQDLVEVVAELKQFVCIKG
jgi:tRNA-splicing ligase RtcB